MSGITQLGSFGSGNIFITPSGANATPIQVGALQDVTADISRTIKKLYGQSQQPLLIGAGELSASIKAKMGYLNGTLYSDVFYGVSSSVGTVKMVANEAGTVPAATTYTVTVANSANWTTDLGVTYANGSIMTRVASAPAQGQYSVAAGVYTFAAADANAAVLISYEYTNATSGTTTAIGVVAQGVQPIVTLDLYRGYNGTGERHRFWACVSSKLSLPTKLADFAIGEMDFDAFLDSSGRFHNIYAD